MTIMKWEELCAVMVRNFSGTGDFEIILFTIILFIEMSLSHLLLVKTYHSRHF